MAKTPAKQPASGKAAPSARRTGTSAGARNAPPPAARTGTTKKPRSKKGGIIPPDLMIPRRKQGHPLKVVARDHKPGTGEPFLRRLLREPRQTIQTTFEQRAPWLDDLIAISLISSGLVSLLALINLQPVERSSVSDYWADFLSQVFGRFGAILFTLLVIGVGVAIILPRLSIAIDLTWRRILGVEIAFVALLAAVHLLVNDPEPRALARSGMGGGHVGWALGELTSRLFGSALATLIFVSLTILGIGMIFGVRRAQIRAGAKYLSARMEQTGKFLAVRASAAQKQIPEAVGRLRLNRGLNRERRHAAPLAPPPIKVAGQLNPPPPSVEATYPTPVQLGATIKSAAVDDSTVLLPPAPPAEQEPPLTTVKVSKPTPIRPAARTGETPAMHPTPFAPSKASRDDDTELLQPPAPIPVRSKPVPQMGAFPGKLASIEDEEAAVEKPPALTPISPIPLRKSSKPVPTPELPPRQVRYFTVEDFKEVKYEYPRPGLPPLSLLNDTELNKPTEDEINANARIIENTLLEFDIDVEVVDARIGPTVTQYAVQPFREVTTDAGQIVTQRVRVNKIVSLANDLGLALAAKRLRIQPFVPGKSYMGIEVPNRQPSIVALRPLMELEIYARARSKIDPDTGERREVPLAFPLGRDVSGEPVITDLASMPHLLIAGTTGSGKSVCIAATVTALIMNNLPHRLKLILLDPKMVELTRFNGLPHLLGPVETDHERIIGVLRWATREMDRRYKLLEVESARNIEAYNRALGKERESEHLPYVVIMVDEIGDLMLSRPEEMERTVTRLAQMARAVGMHLMVATQRPSTDIITGLIKANFPARISFSVVSNTDSRVILDSPGAETLIGKGDMLYLAPDASTARRVQGAFITDEEVEAVMDYWKRWYAEQQAAGMPPPEVAPWERGMTRREALSETESMLEDAIEAVVRAGEASTSLIQRQLNIPFPRAAQIMDLLGQLGILGATREDGRTREVTLKPGTDPYRKLMAKVKRGS